MERSDSPEGPMLADFEAEALRFLPNVARFARLLTANGPDADDLTQETYLRAYRSWHTFRPGTDCRRWLFAICRNLFLHDRRRSQRFVPVDDPDAQLADARDVYTQVASRGLGDLFDRIDLAPAIECGLRALVPAYREVAILVDVEGCSYEDAAAVLGVPIGTIRSRLFRARRLLQQSLIEHARDLGLGRPPEPCGACVEKAS